MFKRKHSGNLSVLVFLLMILAVTHLHAADYFVNKRGADRYNGRSRETAFLTIRKGIDTLKPGDTLTIGPGEYFENVKRENLGSLDAETVIRAEIPGTTLLRGDVPSPEFKKVDGYHFIYAARFGRKPNAIFEHNTMHTLLAKANVAELEFDPGFFYYDGDSKTLYISNRNLTPPDQCRYTISVNENNGLDLSHPRRVVIEGLAVTGFHPGWGICLSAPVSCVVRDCVCFMNSGGITLQPTEHSAGDDCGSDNLIENCVCYGNNFGGIVRYVAQNDVIHNCYTYKNIREDDEHFGIMHYHSMKGPLLIKDNISWGQNFDFSVKPGGRQETLENCVGLGYVRISPNKMVHNLLGGGNEYDRGSTNAPADTVLFLREKDVDKDFEFADSLNLDFRLQPDSRFRGTAPDGHDRGAYPYKANIFYVSPTGDDGADGLSMRKSWRTLERALEGRRPGDTVYLAEGKYAAAPLNETRDGKSPIRICGRGRGTVVIAGKQFLTGGAGIVLERLNFADGVVLENCRDVTFKNCTFFGRADGLCGNDVKNLKVTHCVFAGVPLNLTRSDGVMLSGNLYANPGRPAIRLDAESSIRYSDYNNYQNGAQRWEVNGATWSFAELKRRQHDLYSQKITPKFIVAKGAPRLSNEVLFKSVGPSSTALGIHHEYDAAPETLGLVGPFLHSTSNTTANIEWWTSRPATFSLAWGETPEMKNVVDRFRGTERFNTYSLIGLKPNQTYYFKLVSADASNRQEGVFLPVLRPESAMLSFTTPARPATPRVYYVAPDGHDANDGLSRDKALRTLCRATAQVGPGDTVLIAEGEYNETVRIRSAGTEDRPITFRCITGEKAVHRGEDLPRSFELVVKPDVRVDGIYFRGQSFWREGFVVRQSPRVRITRCLNTMIDATDSPEIRIENCVLHGGWSSVALSRCPYSVVENNVFISTILRQLTADAPTMANRNIFCECVRNKTHQTLLQLSEKVTETDNCFYLRWPEEEKLAVNDLPLPVYRVRTGSNAIAANPMLPGTPGRYQGWQRTSDEDFDQFFTTNPELVLRGIGLQPEAFTDFKLGVADWLYDRAWAETFIEAINAADALTREGKDAEALATYSDMVKNLPMSERLKADVLEKASRCAERLKEDEQAIQLAKDIPVAVISMLRQMELLAAKEKYSELLDRFADDKMGGRNFHEHFVYPELEDVMADLYYHRSMAYAHTGHLEAAEADLRIMNDKRARLQYRSGESIHDLTWLRLGDFYRIQLKDDDRALEAYLKVCDRMTWAPWGHPAKPVSTGASETLVKATEAASDILSKQGKLDEVSKLRINLLKAQAEASAALLKKQDKRSQ